MTAHLDANAAGPLPCVLIGGWLGAGKTTLVNQLLRQADGRRLAVLVNDFGELGIDADLITGAAGEVLELAGGCVCCSYGADLVGTLRRVAARTPRPDVLLIETSGVADPAAVARTLGLLPELALDATVVLADAPRLAALAADRYVGDTVRTQLVSADLLVLNKADGLDETSRAALQPLLPKGRCIETVQAALPIDLVLGLQAELAAPPAPEAPRPLRAPAAAEGRFVSRSALLPAPQDPPALARRLADCVPGVLRAKGLVTDADGQRWLLQVVGREARLAPAPAGAHGPDRLAVIGVAGVYDGAPWA